MEKRFMARIVLMAIAFRSIRSPKNLNQILIESDPKIEMKEE